MRAKSIFRSIITPFNGLFDIVIIARKYCINWIVSIQNWCSSYYKCIYWYFVVFWHSLMTLLSFNQLELMIYFIIEIIKSNCKYRYYLYGEDSIRIERSLESYQRVYDTTVNCNINVMLIINVICRIHLCAYRVDIYVLYKRDNVIKTNSTNLHSIFAAITIFDGLLNLLVICMLRKLFSDCIVSIQNGCRSYYRFVYWYYCTYTHLPIMLPSINQIELIVYDTIRIINTNFTDIKYICGQNAYQNNTNIKACTSMTSTSINDVLILISSDYKSYCLSLICSIMIYLPITSSKVSIYDIIQWIEQYFKNLNDNFDADKPENNQKYQYYGHMHCLIIDCILMCIMIMFWMIYVV